MTESKKRCFVISPIGDPGTDTRKQADLVFDRIITAAMKGFNFDETVRSDHKPKPGSLSKGIFRHIADDELCIAVLTDQNANVCYEVGIAHAHGTPVVMLLREGQKLPQDLKDINTVFYDIENPDKSIQALRSHIDEISTSGWEAESVVPGAMSRQRFDYDVFVSAPMTSIPSDQYPDLRSKVLVVKETLEKDFPRVYSAPVRIKEIGALDPPTVAPHLDITALRRSKYYVLLHPAKLPTSTVVEAGYALAMQKPSVYLYRKSKRDDLSYMLQEASGAYKYVQMLDYDENNFRSQCAHIHTLLTKSPGLAAKEKVGDSP